MRYMTVTLRFASTTAFTSSRASGAPSRSGQTFGTSSRRPEDWPHAPPTRRPSYAPLALPLRDGPAPQPIGWRGFPGILRGRSWPYSRIAQDDELGDERPAVAPLTGSRLARGPLAGPRDGPSRAGRCQPVSRQGYEAPPPRKSGTVQLHPAADRWANSRRAVTEMAVRHRSATRGWSTADGMDRQVRSHRGQSERHLRRSLQSPARRRLRNHRGGTTQPVDASC
jgi:hypothetical protein